MEEVDIIGSDY